MDLRLVPLIVDDGSPEATDYDAPRVRLMRLPDELVHGTSHSTVALASPWRVAVRLLQRGVDTTRRWFALRHRHA